MYRTRTYSRLVYHRHSVLVVCNTAHLHTIHCRSERETPCAGGRNREAQYLPRTELLCSVSLSCRYHQESLGYHPLMVYVDDPFSGTDHHTIHKLMTHVAPKLSQPSCSSYHFSCSFVAFWCCMNCRSICGVLCPGLCKLKSVEQSFLVHGLSYIRNGGLC